MSDLYEKIMDFLGIFLYGVLFWSIVSFVIFVVELIKALGFGVFVLYLFLGIAVIAFTMMFGWGLQHSVHMWMEERKENKDRKEREKCMY